MQSTALPLSAIPPVAASTMSMISQLQGTSADAKGRADRVEQQLESAIRVGLLNSGDKLPPEVLMAEQLGVAPLTLRQSLAQLRSKGLIETKRGRGGGSYVLGDVSVTEAQIDDALLNFTSDQLRDIGDHAGAAAAATARLTALRADDYDLDRVRDLAAAFVAASSPADLRLTDSRLHIGIGVAAQSPRLTAATARIHTDLAPISWGATWNAHRHEAIAEHDALLGALARRDGPEAQRVSLAHYDREINLLIDRRNELVARGGGAT